MGKVTKILLFLILLLIQPVGNITAENLPQETIDLAQSITLDQQYSESDFFYSRFLIDSSIAYSPSAAVGISQTAQTVEIDSQNNIVIVGTTDQKSFPALNGFSQSYSGGLDGYIIKLTENGDIIWGTYLGGNSLDVLIDVKIDSDDNIIVTGYTESDDFPTSLNALDTQLNGTRDIFLSKFSSGGNLIWSTYIGGDNKDGEFGFAHESDGLGKSKLAIDSDNNIFISGTTRSTNFPLLNPYQLTFGGITDVYIAKINSSGILKWSTFFGGLGEEYLNDIMIDRDNNIIIGGSTSSNKFPLLNPDDSANSQFWSGFLAKFTNSGILNWSTYLKGAPNDFGKRIVESIVIDSNNQIFTGGHIDREFTADATDMYFTKYDTDGAQVYKSYYSGVVDNTMNDLTIDADDNLYILHGISADSIDGLPTQNAYFSYGLSDELVRYSKITKFNPANSMVWSTDYLSTSDSAGASGFAVDNKGRLIIIGTAKENNLPGLEVSLEIPLKQLFLSIMKLDPMGDQDTDELLNYEEFNAKTSPYNSDADSDGLNDGDEVHFFNTSPNNLDSDADGLSDPFEISNSFDPNSNDTDRDTMPDKWEFDRGLDPTYSLDSLGDLDNDGLNNVEEYNAQTDPNNPDTDGDGISDGYEVDHNLNPLKDDSNDDRDGDFLPNKFEHDYGLNPDNPADTIIGGLIIIFSASAIIYFTVRLKRLNTKAKKEGYVNHSEKQSIEKRGFSSLEDMNNAEIHGLKNKFARTLVQSSRYQNVKEMVEDWDSLIIALRKSLNSANLKELKELVNNTTSPIHLNEAEMGYMHSMGELNQFLLDFKSVVALQEGLADLPEVDDHLPLINFNRNELENYQNQINEGLSKLKTAISNYEEIIGSRKQWFEPWQPLLTLIQMTQDGLPIDLVKIAEVIRCPEDQAENLLELLLIENKLVGTYKKSNRVYTKGTNISNYIESMLEKIANFGE
ncbi:MAG: hypothetical protein GPJ54_01695 [Candidatus Heimdallarchaeota archaeon]|nr:hypothetical protein [Candidatus Heimdallarchaeota archaeon]